MTTADAPTDFLLVAPLPEERDALLARLPGHRKLPPSDDDIRVYYVAEIPARFPDGRPVTYSVVVLPLARMGHTEAASATGDAFAAIGAAADQLLRHALPSPRLQARPDIGSASSGPEGSGMATLPGAFDLRLGRAGAPA